jgi:hypothetical protein
MKDDFVMEGQYAKKYTEWQVSTGGYARDMTVRDHFAGLAMQELMHEGFELEEIAGCAYEQADAMLKERAK